MKKKFFNLAVILATLMSSTVFYSCDKDDDKDGEDQEDLIDDEKDEENIEENIKDDLNEGTGDQLMLSDELSVIEGVTYAAYNPSIDGGTLNFTVIDVSGTAGSKVVKFKVELKGDVADGQTFEIGDDANHASYFGRIDGMLKACNQTKAVDNAKNIIFALDSSVDTYTITSATVNDKVRAAGATKTEFGTYLNRY